MSDILDTPEGRELLDEARRLASRGYRNDEPVDMIEDVEPAYVVIERCGADEVAAGDVIKMIHQRVSPDRTVSFGGVEMVEVADVQPFGADRKVCFLVDGKLKAFPMEGGSAITVHRPTVVGSTRWPRRTFWQRLRYLFTGEFR